jgi:copper(I)-binding protein
MASSKALVAAFMTLASFIAGGIAAAETYSAAELQIVNPWTRATPGGASVGAGYLTITNKGPETDRLIGGSLAAGARMELHSMVVEGGIAKMRPLPSVEIKPGATVEFAPGGMHMMFMGLKQQLKQGQKLKGTLVFEKAGAVPVEFTVEGIGAPAPSSGHHQH